jgi:hypothetical protein
MVEFKDDPAGDPSVEEGPTMGGVGMVSVIVVTLP